MLNDVTTFCAKAVLGSVLTVSVNVQPSPPAERKDDLQQLRQRVDGDFTDSKVPLGTVPADAKGWGLASLCRRIIKNQIEDALINRNGKFGPSERLHYQQLFNFRYSDNARMLTTGGLLYTEQQRETLQACAFDLLPFLRLDASTEDAFQIEVPQLTYKEVHHLNAQLPLSPDASLTASGIPQSDLNNYAKIYQYHSTFAETEF